MIKDLNMAYRALWARRNEGPGRSVSARGEYGRYGKTTH